MTPVDFIDTESVSQPTIVIQPAKGWVALRLHDLWQYRELLYFLTWREIKVRYKQTAVGAAWAVIQPLLNMLIFTLFFGRLAKVPSDGIPYSVFSLSGLVPWTFFSSGLSLCANSLVSSSNLITKVYFPRLAIPISSVLSGLIDFLLAFVLLIGLMFIKHVHLTAQLMWLPLFLLLALITSLGAGLWLSALNVEYRDVRYVVPFLLQFWMFATPIVYPSSLLPEPWKSIYGINPMAGVIEGFRWSLLGSGARPGPMLAVSSVMSVLIMVSGAFYFRRMERRFADYI